MHGHELAALPLLIFSGLLGPLGWRTRALASGMVPRRAAVEPQRTAVPDQVVASSMSLGSIELALIAEYNLEMARAYEAVADDPTKPLETRRSASERAAAWRGRAHQFQMQARRASADPILPGERPINSPSSAYTGPERRKHGRRIHGRRSLPAVASDGLGPRERRAGADRRRGDRRRPAPAPR